MNAPLQALIGLLADAAKPDATKADIPKADFTETDATRSSRRQRMIAARRFDCISLTHEEFALLPPDVKEEYCRQVRAAQPDLYAETPADITRRWRLDDSRARDRDYQSDHRIALSDDERTIGEKP